MATTASESPKASRRFRVMNCLLAASRRCCVRARHPCPARRGGRSGRETMMPALYPQSLPVYRPPRPVSKRGPAPAGLKKWPFPGPRCSKASMTERYPIRPITPPEFDAFHLVDQHAFHGAPGSPAAREDTLSRIEFDRPLVAFDGSDPVGGTVAFTFQLRVPGATVPAAGVSWV